MDARQVLESVPFFSEVLSSEELAALAANAYELTGEPGASLIRQGDVGSSLLIVVNGTVTVSVVDSPKDRVIASLGVGEIVGEMSLLTGAPRTATVTADDAITALEIDRAAMQPLLARNPDLFDRFADVLERRRAELDKVYGPGGWPFSEPAHSDLAIVIRTYFSTPAASDSR